MISNTFDGGAAITISRVTLEAIVSPLAASGFQRLSGAEARQQSGRQPPHATFQIEAGVDGVAGGEELRLAEHPILEAGRRAAGLGERDLDGDEVVIAGRSPILHGRLDHRKDEAVLPLEVSVAEALGPDELVPA